MSEDNNFNQGLDGRIVQAVRSLKESNYHSSNSGKTSGDSSKSKDDKDKERDDRHTSKEQDKQRNKRLLQGEQMSNSNMNKISIDGSIKQQSIQDESGKAPLKPRNNFIHLSTANKVEIDSRYRGVPNTQTTFNQKSKAQFVKHLMNDASKVKYKASCISILKEDQELKRLCEEFGLANTNFSLEKYIECNFFSNELFNYKLERLLSNEQVMTKNYKEKFFRKEMHTLLYQQSLDIRYKGKREQLLQSLEKNYDFISNIDFLKD